MGRLYCIAEVIVDVVVMTYSTGKCMVLYIRQPTGHMETFRADAVFCKLSCFHIPVH